jgi:hypothetical protein
MRWVSRSTRASTVSIADGKNSRATTDMVTDIEFRITNIENVIAANLGPGAIPVAGPSRDASLDSAVGPRTQPSYGYNQPPRYPSRPSLVAFKMLVSSPSLLRASRGESRRRRQTTRAHGEYAILYLLFQTLTSFSGARCGHSTFDIDCFRAGHFHWCRTHSRPILSSWDNCGRDYSGCVKVVWGKTVLGSFIGCQLTRHRASS